MPVTVPILVPDPPEAPPGYLVVAFQVTSGPCGGRDLVPVCVDELPRAVGSLVERAVAGQVLAAVAWFANRPLEECEPGRERLVSRFVLSRGEWSEWVPEEWVGPRAVDSGHHDRRVIKGQRSGRH